MPDYKLPNITTPLPKWADPETESVFDSTPEKLAKKSVSALREISKFLGYDKPESVMEAAGPGALGQVMVQTAKRIAPKRAATELVDLLLGRSKRLPSPIGPKQLTDKEASLHALLASRTGGIPPKPTRLIVRGDLSRDAFIRRDPVVAKKFKERRSLLNLPAKTADVTVLNTKKLGNNAMTSGVSKEISEPVLPTFKADKVTIHDAIAGANRPVKLKTSYEIRKLLEGPQLAMKAGVLPRDVGEQILAANKARIDEYLAELKKIDLDNYHKQLELRTRIGGQ